METTTIEKLSMSHVKVPTFTGRLSHLTTIPEVLQHYAKECPDKDAMIFVSTDGGRESVTFKDVFEKSEIVAHNLVALGVKPQEVVAINLRTCPEWLYISFGAMMAGAIPAGVAFTYKDGSDLIALMEKLEPCSCLVMDPGFEDENWNILLKLLDEYSSDGSVTSLQMPLLRYLVCHDSEKSMSGIKLLNDLLTNTSTKPELPKIQDCDIAALFQTSGSTGKPKAVAHTHASLLSVTDTDVMEFMSKLTYLCERPFTWVGGYPLNVCMGQTRVTCSGFCPPPKDRARFLTDVILQEQCQMVLCLPSILPEVTKNMADLGVKSPVKVLGTGGQPITKNLLSYVGNFCEEIMVGYGGTEFLFASSLHISSADTFMDYNSGYVISGVEVKIVDGEERVVPVNTCGEIYVKSKQCFHGYYNDKEKTDAVLTEDGWYKTDDLGRFLEDGSLMVEGRKSNMIISGGMNVAPEILETSIAKCPGVESVVLVPVPDVVMYQVICACVKPVPGSDVTEEVVRKFCEDAHGDKLGLFTVLPKYYIILDSFPETSTGKIARKVLASLAEKTFNK